MATEWNSTGNRSDSFGFKGRVVTPASTDLDPIAKSIVMTAAGNITIVPLNNAAATTISFTDLPAGYVIPYFVRQVTACSGTCATID